MHAWGDTHNTNPQLQKNLLVLILDKYLVMLYTQLSPHNDVYFMHVYCMCNLALDICLIPPYQPGPYIVTSSKGGQTYKNREKA